MSNINLKKINKEIWYLLGSLFILIVYLSPYIIWGQECIIRIGDNLDSNVVWQILRSNNIKTFGWNFEIVPQAMNGVPKIVLGSQLNIISFLYLLFPPFTAYTTNLFIMHIVAFIGMRLLLKKLLSTSTNTHLLIVYGVAICFALIDFWPSGGLSIAGQPLLLFAILNIKENKATYLHYIIVILFPLYSSAVLVGFFIIIVFAIWAGIELINTKHFNFKFYYAIIILGLSYAITEFYLIKTLFSNNVFISHRTEFYAEGTTLINFIKESLNLWLYGLASHAKVHQWPIILCLIFPALLISVIKRKNKFNLFYSLLILSIGLAAISALYHWTGITKLLEHFKILKSFDFSRFAWLLPITFYLLFFYSLQVFANTVKNGFIMITIIIFLQIGLEFKRNSNCKTSIINNEFINNFNDAKEQSLSFSQYYSKDIFRDVKNYIGIGQNKYQILCLGIDPGILLFNGFYTLDAYFANYPLNYKHSFRKIIEQELNKNENIKRLFDNFGSTCYLFSSELVPYKIYTKLNPVEIESLEINTKQIKKLGGSYIISTVKINNSKSLYLNFEKEFQHSKSPYKIYLYKLL